MDYDGHGSGRQDRILGHNHDYYLEVRKTMMRGRRRFLVALIYIYLELNSKWLGF